MRSSLASLPTFLILFTFFSGAAAQPPPELGPHRAPPADPEAQRYAHVNGVRLAYQIQGAGPPVVLIHGEPGSHEQWSKQMEPFATEFLTLSYDRRGNGASEAPYTGYSPVAHAHDLNALLEFLGIREAHIVANGRAGMITLVFLKFFPRKVRSIIFADATLPLVDLDPVLEAVIKRRFEEPLPSLEEALKRREERKNMPYMKVARTLPEVREILDRMVDQYSPRIYMTPQRSDIRSALDTGPWNSYDFADMAEISQPILLLVGGSTEPFFMEGAREAHRLLPNTRLEIIPETDHLLMLEAPQDFNRISLDFLRQVETTLEARKKWQGPGF